MDEKLIKSHENRIQTKRDVKLMKNDQKTRKNNTQKFEMKKG